MPVPFRLALTLALLAASPGFAQSAPAAPAPAPAAAESGAPAVPPLTLQRAVELGLQQNHDQINAESLALQSAQDQRTALSAILPQLNFNASATRVRSGESVQTLGGVTFQSPTAIYSLFGAQVQLTQLVFDGGKWWNNLAVAEATLAAVKEQAEEQRLQTTYLVEQAYYELLRAQQNLRVLGEAAARSRDQADFTDRLYQGGRATQADVYAARANRDNDEITRLKAEAAVEIARQGLSLVVGLDPTEPLTPVDPAGLMDEPAVAPKAQEAVARSLSQRPSLRAYAHLLESNRKLVAASLGGYWPQVSVQGSYARNARDATLLYSSPETNSTLSGSVLLQWNIFAGFSTDAAVTKQRLQVMAAENDLRQGRRAVASDVEKAIANLLAVRQEARVASQAQDTAREGLRLARTRQQVGVGTQLEVRDAELKLTQSELARVNALLDGREQESALRRAAGG